VRKLIYHSDVNPPEFFKACLSISQKLSGQQVVVIDTLTGFQQLILGKISRARKSYNRLDPHALIRWVAIFDYAKTMRADEWPIFTADWDTAVCSDLTPLFEATKDADLCFTCDDNGMAGVASIIRSIEPLRDLVIMLLSMIQNNDPLLATVNDMELWKMVVDAHGYSTRNVNLTPEGAVDHNLACGSSQFQMERTGLESNPRFTEAPLRKKIVYTDGQAHFVALEGNPVRALSIHFWDRLEPLVFEVAKHLL
jgi:hypothetical protein